MIVGGARTREPGVRLGPSPEFTDKVTRFSTPRVLHPAAWWGWALGCAVVASRTINPVLLGLVIAIVCLTVVVRRGSAPWALAFRMYVYLACLIVVLRVGFRILFSAAGPTVLLRLPTITIPGLSSLRLLGPVSAEALLSAGQSGLQLAAMVMAIGAANALANPKRLLASVPGALYEWGAVVVIALSVFPQLAESLVRVHRARQLRAETGHGISARSKGVHLIRTVAMPVLSDGLDRSLTLASAMDSRGYGRSAAVAPRTRKLTSLMLVVSSLALCVGAYGLLDTGHLPVWIGAAMVVTGLVVGLAGLKASGRRVVRTRYRPDRMKAPEWVVLSSGILACVGIIVVGATQVTVVYPPVGFLQWPQISVGALLAVLVLIVPALVAPPAEPVPASLRPRSAASGSLADAASDVVDDRARVGVLTGRVPVVSSVPRQLGLNESLPDSSTDVVDNCGRVAVRSGRVVSPVSRRPGLESVESVPDTLADVVDSSAGVETLSGFGERRLG